MPRGPSVETLVSCPCCGRNEFQHLVGLGKVPISGVFRALAYDPIELIDLSFEVCTLCGLVRQEGLSRPRDYSSIDRSTAPQLPRHLEDLIRQLEILGTSAEDLILEIGANDGSFLAALSAAGYRNTAGIEPSVHLSGLGRSKGMRIHTGYFDSQAAQMLVDHYGPARIVICRHTLEHVPDPATFVRCMRASLDSRQGVLLLEVPDGSAIPDLMNVYEF